MKPDIGTREIVQHLARTQFSFRRYLVVEGISWGMLPWEADLLACTPEGYLYEVEVKVSIADLKRDPLKDKWKPGRNRTPQSLLRGMWYAMPASVWAHKDAAAQIPEFAGVITLEREPLRPGSTLLHGRMQHRIVRHCKRTKAPPISQREQLLMAKLGAMRAWSR